MKTHVMSFLSKAVKCLSVVLLLAMLFIIPASDAEADSYLNAPLNNGIEDGFQVSGEYLDTGIGTLVEYILREPPLEDPSEYGRRFTIYGLFFGDENNVTIPTNWTQSVSTNSDSSENHTFTKLWNGSSIATGNPQSFGILWDGTQPSGIGSMALDSYLKVEVKDGYNDVFTGWIPAPDAVTSDLPEYQNPTVVPEPVSSILFAVGGATLGFRRFWKKRKQI